MMREGVSVRRWMKGSGQHGQAAIPRRTWLYVKLHQTSSPLGAAMWSAICPEVVLAMVVHQKLYT